MKKILFTLLIVFVLLSSGFSQVPKWALELNEPIKEYDFLQDGKYLFLRNGEYAWLYDSNNGQKIYDLEVNDFESKGVQSLVGEKYLVSTSDKVLCYNALNGKLIWQQEYEDVSQDEYSDLSFIGEVTILKYGSLHIAIDLNNGKELWRQVIHYNGNLNKPGKYNWNWTKIDKQKKLLVMVDDNQLALYNFNDGKKIFNAEDYEVNSDLIKKQYAWYYSNTEETYALFCLDESVAVVDLANNKEVFRKPIKFDSDYDPLMPTPGGCAVLGDDKLIYFDDKTGNLIEVKASADDFRTYKIMEVAGKSLFVAGLSDQMFVIDLAAGKLLWQSKEEDKQFEGYAHRYLGTDGNNILVSYGNSYVSNRGTSFTLMSIDAFTGKVNYKTPEIARSGNTRPNWVRAFVSWVQAAANQERTFGYDKLGIEYSTFDYKGNLVFAVLDNQNLENPDTRDSGGDGLVIVDPKTGNILFKDYLKLVDYTSAPPQPNVPLLPTPILDGKYVILLGDEGVAVYDLDLQKRMFSSLETLKGFPEDAMIIDDALYVKFGTRKFKVILSEAKTIFDTMGMKVEDMWDEDPYGFAAYDIKSGKLLWRTETKVDPGFLTPQFSLRNNYEPTNKRLYFGDEENIYALQLKPDGGKYDYTVNLDDIKIGEMPFKKTYAIQEWPIGSVKLDISTSYTTHATTTTISTYEELGGKEYNQYISALEEADASTTYESWFTVWGAAAKKCLRVVYDNNYIFAMGKEGIAMLNAADGKVKWLHEWQYDKDNVQYMPHIFGDKLIYCVEKELTCVDMASGKVLWKADEAKRPIFFTSPNGKFMFTINKEVIKGYQL